MADKKEEKVEKDLKVEKAEWPLNFKGLGYRSTLEAGPFFKEDVDYLEPEDNYRYTYCGACAFYSSRVCSALQEEVEIVSSCHLYIPMAHELELRWISYIRSDLSQKAEEEDAVKEDKELTQFEVKFASFDEERKLVYGEVLVPDDVDAHEDTITAKEIEFAAHKFAMTPMIIGDGHKKRAKAKTVETFIYNPKMLKKVKEGSWVMAVKVLDDDMWEGVKSGDYTGFSIGAYVKKRPVEEDEE